jgi:hypothetical protein
MRESAIRLARPNAADEIADECAAILSGRDEHPNDEREDAPCNES